MNFGLLVSNCLTSRNRAPTTTPSSRCTPANPINSPRSGNDSRRSFRKFPRSACVRKRVSSCVMTPALPMPDARNVGNPCFGKQEMATPSRVSPPRSAVLDDAHVGDIEGALGTIAQHDTAPRTNWRARLRTLRAIIGPGLIVMVGDNDAGAFGTYTQGGRHYRQLQAFRTFRRAVLPADSVAGTSVVVYSSAGWPDNA